MDNSIFKRQKDRDILLLLKAQRNEYTKAKSALYPGLYLGIGGTIVFSVLTSVLGSGLITTLSSFIAIVVFAITSFLEKKSIEYVELAAKIQQTIDTRLFQMSDNCHTLLPSEINEIVALYPAVDLSEFENWYSDYSSLDFPKQVLFSQKENIRWDKKLREKFSHLIISLMAICPILLIIYTILTDATASHFFGIVSWLFPLEQFLITQWIGLKNNIKYLEKVNIEYRDIEKSYDKYSTNEVQCKLCGLQTYIFEHRKKSVLIPDWFYKKHQKEMQKYENSVAKETSDSI